MKAKREQAVLLSENVLHYVRYSVQVLNISLLLMTKQLRRVSRTLIFKRKKKNDISSKTERVVPCELNYPKRSDFYSIISEEYSGALPIHSVRMSFVLPYDDWCEFEKSNLFRLLSEYLEELQKRENQNEKKAHLN